MDDQVKNIDRKEQADPLLNGYSDDQNDVKHVAEQEGDADRNGGVCRRLLATTGRLRTDPVYRHRIIHTAVICWAFVGLGWCVGLSGPTFPDIRLIMGEDLATASWIFTAGSFGYMTGSLSGGVLYDRFNKLLLLAASTFGLAVSTAAVPYCSSLVAMLAIKFLGGFACGHLDAGGNADILHIWGSENGPYMQAAHFGFSLGALLSPLATGPFLTKKTSVCDTRTSGEAKIGSNITVTDTVVVSKNGLLYITDNNRSNGPQGNRSVVDLIANPQNPNCYESYGESKVSVAFWIAAIIVLTSAFGFMFMYIKLKCSTANEKADVKEASKVDREKVERNEMTVSVKVSILVVLCILMAAYCTTEDCFSSFLMTFGLTYLDWDEATGAYATATFWTSFGVGRFIGIFTVSCCSTVAMLTTYLGLLTLGYIGFMVSSIYRFYPLIWTFTAGLGFAMSVIFPAIFSWTSKHVIHVSGKISGMFLVSASVSGMCLPLLIGHLMEYFSPMWFVYILVLATLVCLLSYATIRLLVRTYVKDRLPNEESVEIHIDKESLDV
ncbi:MFS4B-like protein [Mya arenaria]|uniref:MFS4B-like protein n=1 Tax=Mya arenaria TaxID=6604 RepID=A0ABY7FD10_MYAAR|nr:sodium-dependent glucose transporter 1A-like [Mya arenaria]WAR18912.1 MFS4B-like protein [Mya arenaria]